MARFEAHPDLTGRADTGSPLTASVLFVVLAMIVPIVLYTTAADQVVLSAPIFTLALVGLGSSAGLAAMVFLGRPHYLRLSFYVFVYVFIFLAGSLQILSQTFPLDARTYTGPVLRQTTTVLAVGFFAHELGYFLGPKLGRTGRRSSVDEPAPQVRSFLSAGVSPRGAWIAVLVLGVGASLFAIGTAGFAPFFQSRDAVGALSFGDTGPAYALEGKGAGIIYNKITHIPVFLALYFILWIRRRERRDSPRAATLPGRGLVFDPLVLFVLVALNLVMNNPIGNSRLWAGIVVFSLVSLYLDLRKPRVIAAMASLLILLYVVVFPVADSFRRSESAGIVLRAPVDSLKGDGSFSAFQTTANGVEYLADHAHTGGRQILGAFLTLVPRAWWPGKPVDTGSLIDSRFNRASTIWTEGQVDFGIIGVVVVLFALGLAMSQVDASFASADRNSASNVLLPILAPFYVFLLRGSLGAAIGALLPLLLFLALCFRIHRTSRPGDGRTWSARGSTSSHKVRAQVR